MKLRIQWALAFVLIAPSVFASVNASAQQQPLSPGDQFFIGIGAPRDSVWTGRTHGPDGTPHEEALSATFARDLRKELAAIQVSIDVDRAFEAAATQLDDLAIRATRRGYPDRLAVLVEIAVVRTSVLETLGQRVRALSAATTVFVNPRVHVDTSRYEFVGLSTDDQKLAEQAAADPHLVQARARLAPAAKAAPAGPDDKITEIVLAALSRGDKGSLDDLGDRALPALEKEIARDFDVLPESSHDALRQLTSNNPRRAAEFMRIHFDAGGAVWKARMVRAIRQVSSGWAKTFWLLDGDGRKNAIPEWPPVIERLLEDPTSARDALDFLRDYFQFDALTPGLQQQVAKILTGSDAKLASATVTAMWPAIGRPTAQPVFEVVLASPHADVRAFSAGVLAQYPSSEALIAACASPDAAVRSAVASALRRRFVAHVDYSNGGTTRTNTAASIGARERDVLVRLVADVNADVRAEAAISIAELTEPLDAAVYERIAKDSDTRVRAALLASRAVPLAVRARLAAALASDPDPQVIKSFDEFLFTELSPAGTTFNELPIDPAFFDAIRARRQNKAPPMERTGSSRLYDRLMTRHEGLAALLSWTLAENDVELASRVILRLYDLMNPRASDKSEYARATAKAVDAGIDATPAQLVALFGLAQKLLHDDVVDARLVLALVWMSDDLAPLFLPIAQDAKRPVFERFEALDIAARAPGNRVGPLLLGLLADGRLVLPETNRRTQDRVAAIADALSDEEARATLNVVSSDPRIPNNLRWAFIRGFVHSRVLDSQRADSVLTLWFSSEGELSAARAALSQVASRPREDQGDWLMRAVRNPGLCVDALTLIGGARDPQYLTLLEECLSPAFAFPDRTMEGIRTQALNALTRYFDEPAAAIILKAAGSTSSASLRDECFKALETIRKYQAEKGLWEESRTSKEATAAAVRDLLVLLDDTNPTVRAQALRGLATLNAVEQMPRIVRMLKDSDESVRKMADYALGVLNAPPMKKD